MKSNLPDAFTKSTPWDKGEDPIWLGSAIILHRNIHPFLFPALIPEGDAKHTISLIENHLSPLLKEPMLFPHDTLSPADKEFIFEHFILSEGYEKFDARKAFLLDSIGSILCLLNVEDHLHLHLFSNGAAFDNLFKQASLIERTLSETLPFAFSPRFGYLTSDPMLCGTGLAIQAFLHLPALIALKKISEAIDKIDSSVTVRGLGKENEYLGDLVLLENKYKLGVTEEGAFESVTRTSQELISLEKTCRTSLSSEDLNILKDLISRAYGLLLYAVSLDIGEALQCISLLDLAKDLKWLKNAPDLNFKTLFFQIRRAHLMFGDDTSHGSKEILMKKRADLVRKTLENSSLTLSENTPITRIL